MTEARPDAEISWWISTKDARSGYQPWTGDLCEIQSGAPIFIRVGARNTGGTSAFKATVNLVAPLNVDIEQVLDDDSPRPPLTGFENPKVGVAPEHSVKLFTADRYWPKGLIWPLFFRIAAIAGQSRFKLLFEFNDAYTEYQSLKTISVHGNVV
jgi:hypothetical protein